VESDSSLNSTPLDMAIPSWENIDLFDAFGGQVNFGSIAGA
jgi:hypothetical protein